MSEQPDPQLVAIAAEELAALGPMELVLRPISVFQFAGIVQLALRHPDIPADIRATAEKFLAGVREYFAACPAALEIVRRGDDPAEDLPR